MRLRSPCSCLPLHGGREGRPYARYGCELMLVRGGDRVPVAVSSVEEDPRPGAADSLQSHQIGKLLLDPVSDPDGERAYPADGRGIEDIGYLAHGVYYPVHHVHPGSDVAGAYAHPLGYGFLRSLLDPFVHHRCDLEVAVEQLGHVVLQLIRIEQEPVLEALVERLEPFGVGLLGVHPHDVRGHGGGDEHRKDRRVLVDPLHGPV